MNKKINLIAVMLLTCLFSMAQRHFNIVVKDADGKPIAGASVKGPANPGGITNSEGRLELIAADTAKLLISAKGYLPLELVLQKSVLIRVTLAKEIKKDERVIVYAFAQRNTWIHTAAAVNVLNKDYLQRLDQSSFVPAFNTVPGVKMDERSPGSYRISIRGNLLRSAFGIRNVKIYLNGLPYTDASGNTYFNELAVNSIDHIEIIKGPGGSMYGAGTGGVILLANDPSKKRSEAGLSGGSYGMFSAGGKYFFGKSNTAQSVSCMHTQSSGYRQQSAMRRDVVGYTISVKAGGNNTITGNILYSNLFYKTPGGLTLAQLSANPRRARPASALFPGAVTQHTGIYLSTIYTSVSDEIKISSKWTNSNGGYFSYTAFKNPAIRNFQQDNQKGAGGRNVFIFHAGKYAAAFGGEYQYSFFNTATYGNRQGVKDTLQYHDKIAVHQLNIFAQAGMDLPLRSEFTAGISYNDFYYGFHRVSIPGLKDRGNFSPQFIPRVSLMKKIKGLGSAYLSYSKGYSPPGIDEVHASDGIFNRSLGAEQGTNYEAGAKVNLLKSRMYAGVSGYIFHLQHTIVSRQNPGGAEYFVNAGRTNQHGLEFSAGWAAIEKRKGFIKMLKLQNSTACVHAVFADYKKGTADYSGNRLTGTVPFVSSLLADLRFAEGIYSDITYTYTGRMPLNDANSFFAKAYNLLFVKFGRETKLPNNTSLDIFCTLQKSFNKNYSLGNDLNADANRFFNPSAMQAFTGGVKMGF